VRRGRHIYNFWRDAKNPRGLWRRTALDSFRTEEPVWEILLDVDALAAHEKEDWVWHGASTLPATHDRAILSLSRGGSDAAVLRDFYEPAAGGHGYGRDNKEMAAFIALGYSFLREKIGWSVSND